MLMRLIACLAMLAVPLAPGAAVAASEVEVLIDRRSDQVSVYFALPAPTLDVLFGQGAEPLLDPDGTVDIDGLYDGTFLVADDIFAGSTLSVAGEPVVVEALSMMLHDPDFLPSFADPYDAQVSIAVCTSPETVRGMTLPELRAYLGYFAWQVDGYAPLEISLPTLGRDAVTVTLRDFVDFREVSTTEIVLADGGTIVLPEAPDLPAEMPVRGLALGAVVVASLALVGLLLMRRRRPVDVVKGS